MLPASHPQSATISLPVAIELYFEVALYLMVLTGFGTLASTGGLDTPTVGFVGAALLFRGYVLARRRTVLIPENWTTLLTLVYVAFYLADYFLFSRAFLNATVHLVLFVLVVRLFSTSATATITFWRSSRSSWCWPPPCSPWTATFGGVCRLHADGGGYLHPDGNAAALRQGHRPSQSIG